MALALQRSQTLELFVGLGFQDWTVVSVWSFWAPDSTVAKFKAESKKEESGWSHVSWYKSRCWVDAPTMDFGDVNGEAEALLEEAEALQVLLQTLVLRAGGGGGGEGGGAQQLQQRVETLEDEVETLQDCVATLQTSVEELEDQQDEVREECRLLALRLNAIAAVPGQEVTMAD